MVQAHDILMGKIDLEGSENEEEWDEVRTRRDLSKRECAVLHRERAGGGGVVVVVVVSLVSPIAVASLHTTYTTREHKTPM